MYKCFRGFSNPTKTSKNFNLENKFNKKNPNTKTAHTSSNPTLQIAIKELIIILLRRGQDTTALTVSGQALLQTSRGKIIFKEGNMKFCLVHQENLI
jgi:hypothetical protein